MQPSDKPAGSRAGKPRNYSELLAKIKERIRSAQYAALKAVNQELFGLALLGHRADDREAAGGCRLGQGGGGTTRRRSTGGVSRRGQFFGLQPLADESLF